MDEAAAVSRAGLCASCVHARRVPSSRGAVFLLCELSSVDPRFPRYPPLPVTRCGGYTPADEGDATGGTGTD
jgi:hypothetical protein